jgi:phosphatidylserine/phosphatidylglycerophosphate/cardiolipin synthase-like enzyme
MQFFAAIMQAKSYIFVQYYIFRPDSLGEKFKDLLISKAKDGVTIFFIFDNIGSVGLTGRYIRDLKKHGIEVARFLPFHFRFHLQVNFRNHRKLVLVDGKIAFVGGMNVGNEYLSKGKFWRDTQISIEGPAIAALAETFLEDWSFAVSPKKRYLPSPFISTTTELYKHENVTVKSAERVPQKSSHLVQETKQTLAFTCLWTLSNLQKKAYLSPHPISYQILS